MKLTCNTTFSIKKEDFLQCGSSVISPTIIYVTNELLHVLLMYSKQGNCMYYMYIQVGTKPFMLTVVFLSNLQRLPIEKEQF